MTTRRVLGVQHISRMCMVCGTDNEAGLRTAFYELEGDELLGVFTPREQHQGYPGRLHGGIASTLLDETMGRAITFLEPEVWGVTIELTVRFRKPVPLDNEVRALGRITRNSSRVFEGTGEIVLSDGTIAVEASGKYVKLPIDRIAQGDFEEQWIADERDAPTEVELP